MATALLQAVALQIRARTGLRVDERNEALLDQALTRRRGRLDLGDAAYLRRLETDEDEFRQLVELLTINETYFFREPEQIACFVERIVPCLLARPGGEPIRVLSAGCASGEEPYSLGMALLDALGPSATDRFVLHGADINGAVLDKARRGVFRAFSFRGVAEATRSRYFSPAGNGLYALCPELTRWVTFHPLNLLADPYPPPLGDYDVVFFRNVSIYFDTPTREAILRRLAAAMRADGVLILGSAETLANDLGVFRLVSDRGLFHFVKGAPPVPGATAAVAERRPAGLQTVAPQPSLSEPLRQAVPVPDAPARAEPTPAPAWHAQARRAIEERRLDDARILLERALLAEPGDAEARLLMAFVSLELRAAGDAQAHLAQRLAEAPWDVDALLLSGLAAKQDGRQGDAIASLRRAVYADPGCWAAHYFLAGLLRDAGEPSQAARAYSVVLRLTRAGATSSGTALPLRLEPGAIRQVCEHQLARLSATPSAS